MNLKLFTTCFLIVSTMLIPGVGLAQADLPKYNPENLRYEGAFRLPKGTFGDARVAWSRGKIAVDETRGTFFFSGSDKKSVAEFQLPNELTDSRNMADLIIVNQPVQDFKNILDNAETGNPNDVNTITGMGVVNGKLVVNAAEYYDANANNFDTTLIFDDPTNIHREPVKGYVKLKGGNRAAGWISKIPPVYQADLGGELIFGHANNLPINGRSSMGPSAYSVKTAQLDAVSSGSTLDSTELLGFSINNLLHPDVQNKTLENDLWTELSRAAYGFIVPGTSTYLTIGQTGGVKSGIGYKITQENGNNCGGFCAYDYKDYYNQILLWDVNDLIKAKNGLIEPHKIRPYYHDRFDVPFQMSADGSYVDHLIIGGTSISDGKLYLVIGDADTLQSQYESQAIIVVYDLNIGYAPGPPADITVN